MSEPTTLTVAIPYYAGRDFLARAVASVQRQTWPHWRLLVCDDRGSEERVDDLIVGSADPRQAYARNAGNLGMAGNWNRCLDLAETELVTLLHSDDELMEGYCEQMVRAAQAYPEAAAFFCAAQIIDREGRQRFSFPDLFKRFLMRPRRLPVVLGGEESLEALLRGNFIMCPTVCYRKSRLGLRRFDSRWKFVLDLDFFARLLLDGERSSGCPPSPMRTGDTTSAPPRNTPPTCCASGRKAGCTTPSPRRPRPAAGRPRLVRPRSGSSS